MTRDPRLSWVRWVDLCALGVPLVDNGEGLLQMRLWSPRKMLIWFSVSLQFCIEFAKMAQDGDTG